MFSSHSRSIIAATFCIVIILIQVTNEAEATNILTPIPGTPYSPGSGVLGSLQCTKNSDESYAVCASYSSNCPSSTTFNHSPSLRKDPLKLAALFHVIFMRQLCNQPPESCVLEAVVVFSFSTTFLT